MGLGFNKTKAQAEFNQKEPLIFGIGAAIGLVVTAILAAKGQKKADDILDERKETVKSEEAAEEKSETEEVKSEPSKKEVFNLTWKCYVPAAISGIFTFGCIIGGSYISWKKIVGLTGTISFLVKERNNLERGARKQFGDEAVDKIKKEMEALDPRNKKKKEEPKDKKEDVKIVYKAIQVDETGHGDFLCEEKCFGRKFRADPEFVEAMCEEFNKALLENGLSSVNDIYDYWDLEPTDVGDQYGWFYDKDHPDYCNYDEEEGVKFSFAIGFNEKLQEDCLYISCWQTPPSERFLDLVDS